MTYRSFSAVLLAACLLTALPLPSWAQGYAVQPESRMWIEGRSTVGTFTCRAAEVEGGGALDLADRGQAVRAHVYLPVRRLDCGDRRMNADLYDALEAETHPLIRFELTDAEALELTADTTQWSRLRATGDLTLAGASRRVDVLVRWQRLEDDRLRGYGEKRLRMSDFGVQPPTAFLGLIRAHDRITVRFDLVAVEEQALEVGGR